jgi:alpha-L-fucosidase 2
MPIPRLARHLIVLLFAASLTPACRGSAGGAPGTTTGAGGSAAPDAGDARDAGDAMSDGGAGGMLGTGGDAPPAGPEGPNAEAFDPVAGALNVDYGGFLSKHDVVFKKPNTDPIQGLTVGNGRTGAMVWSANGLTMQVSGIDTSQQTAFSAGLVNLQTTPALDAGTTAFEQRLSLYDGTLTTSYGSDRRVTIVGAPLSEVMGIHIDDARAGASAVVELSLWDLSTLTNAGNVPDINTWKTVTTFADAGAAGLSRGQTDANHFGYTLAATVEGAAFTATVPSAGRVRLTIAPASSYTIWVGCASRLNAPGNDSVAAARAELTSVTGSGYATTSAGQRAWWHAFWARSFVQYAGANGTADYLENVYYLATYMIASGAFGHYPFHFINGVFRATADNTKWSNAYWYWNQRDVYNSFLASNHADVMRVFNAMYSAAAPALRSFTQSRFGIAGIWVPETMGWNGNADGTINSDFTKNIYSTGFEAAANMYLESRYTGDAGYLSATVYPFMRDVANFYTAKLARDPTTGQYGMASSNAHETYWNVPNAITDLAAVRSLFPLAIATSTQLGLDTAARAQWQTILDNLAPYSTDGKSYLPYSGPAVSSHNGENVACELIWPYGVTGIGAPDYALALSTWKTRPFPYGNVWANDAIQAARLGLGDDAYKGLVTMLQKYQSYPNGMTNNTNGVFEYLGVHLSAINESLLQSYDDTIRVFPAMPGGATDATFVGRFTLAAKGGFLVSAEKDAADIKYVGLASTRGGTAHIANPWGTQALQARRTRDAAIVASATSATFDLPTDAGAVYVVERVARPLSSYDYARITGSTNTSSKTLAGTPCTLGQ